MRKHSIKDDILSKPVDRSQYILAQTSPEAKNWYNLDKSQNKKKMDFEDYSKKMIKNVFKKKQATRDSIDSH